MVLVFEYGVGGHFWVTILDLKVKMASECSKNHSIRSEMPYQKEKLLHLLFWHI